MWPVAPNITHTSCLAGLEGPGGWHEMGSWGSLEGLGNRVVELEPFWEGEEFSIALVSIVFIAGHWT